MAEPGTIYEYAIGKRIQVTENAVRVITDKGVYSLDKKLKTWSPLAPPDGALRFHSIDIKSITERQGKFWFMGYEDAIASREKIVNFFEKGNE